MRSSYINVKNWRKNTKLRLIEAFGGSCGICGYNKCETALEFHHLNPKKKELLITSRCRAWTKTVDEARKCIMLCANCHREIHTGLISLPKNIKRFNEDFINYKASKYCNECPVCGKTKPMSQKTCSRSCGATIRYNINWDIYDLKQLYNEIGSIVGIAKYIGNVSDNAVRKRMEKEGISTDSSDGLDLSVDNRQVVGSNPAQCTKEKRTLVSLL